MGSEMCIRDSSITTGHCPPIGGQCPVVMEYVQPKGSVAVRLGGAWQVHPSDALLDELRIAVGNDAVDWVYES